MLQPKTTKYRKSFKGRNRGLAHSKRNSVAFGEFGMKAVTRGQITSRQIESSRRALSRFLRRSGTVVIRIFPDKPITKKPLEVRQGKGKGNVEFWVAPVRPGSLLFEIAGVSLEDARQACLLASAKLPVQTKFVLRELK